ncbi:hypothetical protein GRX66_14445, partial [Halobacterium sp. PCN9]|nr:hypothetical protein [Halobacterium bonnevillei]
MTRVGLLPSSIPCAIVHIETRFTSISATAGSSPSLLVSRHDQLLASLSL